MPFFKDIKVGLTPGLMILLQLLLENGKTKRDNNDKYWLNYRVLRNKWTRLIKNTKSEHYLNLINENLNDPPEFWKLVKSSSDDVPPFTIAEVIITNQGEVRGKQNIVVPLYSITLILYPFNKHCINAGMAAQLVLPFIPVDSKTTTDSFNISLNKFNLFLYICL